MPEHCARHFAPGQLQSPRFRFYVVGSEPLVIETPPNCRRLELQLSPKAAKSPGMKRKRLADSTLEAEDFSNDDPVIPARMNRVDAATETAQRIREMRRPRVAAPVGIDVELLAASPCKVPGHVELIMREHVDSKRCPGCESPETRALVREAPQNERWLQRHGREGIHCGTDGLTIGANARDHRNARSECAERIAQLTSREGPRNCTRGGFCSHHITLAG